MPLSLPTRAEADERLRIGDTVHLSRKARQENLHRPHLFNRMGKVVKVRNAEIVLVLWDGLTGSRDYHVDFLDLFERAEAAGHG